MQVETKPKNIVRSNTWIEIDVSALRHNVQAIRDHLSMASREFLSQNHPPKEPINTNPSSIMPIVKANAYGHGLLGCASVFREEGTDRFGVASLREAYEIRYASHTRLQSSNILVLTPPLPEEADEFCKQRVEFVAADLRTVEAFSRAAQKHNQVLDAHLWIDTGMAREGISPEEAVLFAETCRKFPLIRLLGLCTHFATAEDPQEDFANTQLQRFEKTRRALQQAGFSFPLMHAANSGALLRFSSSHFSAVRPGLLLYGHCPHQSLSHRIAVRPALSLHTRVVSLRNVQAGESVGYGQAYRTSKATVVATLPIGYADGLSREYHQGLFCLVRGEKYPVVGRVCMNHCMVDMGDGAVALGDEAVLIGKQGHQSIQAEELAYSSNTIVYKTLAALSEKIPRVFIHSNP